MRKRLIKEAELAGLENPEKVADEVLRCNALGCPLTVGIIATVVHAFDRITYDVLVDYNGEWHR